MKDLLARRVGLPLEIPFGQPLKVREDKLFKKLFLLGSRPLYQPDFTCLPLFVVIPFTSLTRLLLRTLEFQLLFTFPWHVHHLS